MSLQTETYNDIQERIACEIKEYRDQLILRYQRVASISAKFYDIFQ